MLKAYVLGLLSLTICTNSETLHHKGTISELRAYKSYALEAHTVLTSDGYILELHRLSHGPSHAGNTTRKPAVLFVHGTYCTSLVWIINNHRNRSLAFSLADLGYDVWLANLRGNPFSMRHVSLDANRDAAEYWNFTLTEYSVNDLKAIVDFILNATRMEKLHYVGHSLGGLIAFVFLSVSPEYNRKMEKVFLLAPVSYFQHFKNVVFIAVIKICGTFQPILYQLGIYRFGASLTALTRIQRTFPLLYEMVLFAVFGEARSKIFDRNLFPAIATTLGGYTGIKVFKQYNQFYKSGRFSYYDYGNHNIEIYGQETPPDFQIGKITAPVYGYFAVNDALVALKDCLHALSQLPNLRSKQEMWYKQYGHMDYIWSKTVSEDVNNKIIFAITSDNGNGR